MRFHLPSSFIAVQSFASLGSVTEMFHSYVQSYHLQRANYVQGIAGCPALFTPRILTNIL